MVLTAYRKPLPVIPEYERPAWDGAKQRKLMLQRCANCRKVVFPFNSWCPACHSTEIEWFEGSGKGTVVSRIIYHQAFHPGFEGETPYNVIWVRLDEGPLFTSNLVGGDFTTFDSIKPGMRVEAVYEDVTDEITLTKFRPAEE